jgi:hypothetical protein
MRASTPPEASSNPVPEPGMFFLFFKTVFVLLAIDCSPSLLVDFFGGPPFFFFLFLSFVLGFVSFTIVS